MKKFLYYAMSLVIIQMIPLSCLVHMPKDPDQVHISFGTNFSEMIVTWHTLQPIHDDAYVLYGLEEDQLTSRAKAEVSYYAKISLYTYRALMINLEPLTRYCKQTILSIN